MNTTVIRKRKNAWAHYNEPCKVEAKSNWCFR